MKFGVEGLDWCGINSENSGRIERSFEEIKRALFQCEGDKAPGPDGFTMAALQEGWEIIKDDALKDFKNFTKVQW